MPPDTGPEHPEQEIGELLDSLRRQLVGTDTRNRLIHVKRSARRANALDIINEKADEVFKILKNNGKKMEFAATGQDPDEDEQDDPRLDAAEEPDEDRYTDQYLETPMTPDGLQKRLLRLARASKTAEEEQGVNILYLAMGFLRWYEDENSNLKREAPLVLLPVELVRNNRTSTYEVKVRDDDIVTNLPLQERLQDNFGITLPEIEIDESTPWMPSQYYAQVREMIAARARWEIDEDGMQIGFFSFSKLLMLRDLDPTNWPEESALTDNELIRNLLQDGFAPGPPLFADDDRLDDRLPPENIFHVVDADGSQTKVIEEVRSGKKLVVQGPPGTGKSQTITNILAAAAHDGKRILFIAEKMAALKVVHDRMGKSKLKDLCLELHSRSANKKAFLNELKRTLANRNKAPDMPADPQQLRKSRDELNMITSRLHTEVPERDYTPFSAMADCIRLRGRNVPPPQFQAENLDRLTDAKRDEIERAIKDIITVGSRRRHPFHGTRNCNLQPPDLQRLETELATAISGIDAVTETLGRIEDIAQIRVGHSMAGITSLLSGMRRLQQTPGISGCLSTLYPHLDDRRFREGLAAGKDWRTTKKTLSGTFKDDAWNTSVTVLRSHLVKGAGSFFARLFGKYRGASAEFATLLAVPLPPAPSERVDLVDSLLSCQKKQQTFRKYEAYLENKLGAAWHGEQTDFARLVSIVPFLKQFPEDSIRKALDGLQSGEIDLSALESRLNRLRQDLAAPLNRLDFRFGENAPGLEQINLEAMKGRLERMQQTERYSEWARIEKCAAQLTEAGLEDLVTRLDEERLAPEAAPDAFLYAVAEARWEFARQSLGPNFDTLCNRRHELVSDFQDLDKERFREVQTLILSKHLNRLNQLPQEAEGEMNFIRGEMGRRRGHRPIRRIMETAGSAVQRIKPIFLMSPISVAQFLPPGRVEFDLLVIDEASQVRPEDAFGSIARIARTGQIVVVGDQKQLPPTSFFERLMSDTTDEDEEDTPAQIAQAGEMESILSLCEARGLKQSMLEWHYRSRDPSLITVSNEEFYGNRLILPPSPSQRGENHGLQFTMVQGVYSSTNRGGGRPGTNRIEAEAVVEALTDHAEEQAQLSVGIATFSKAQADMMTLVLEHARRKNKTLDNFLREGRAEDVFVKNIENVQGDERDVILISVGYGPHEPGGRLAAMNFGPINRDGGERRLNVLFSRARSRCQVFSSFDPGEIDLARAQGEGPRVLKRFLQYAKSGELNQPLATGGEADSPFEEDVKTFIGSLGYPVDPQVGSAGFRIDLGVRNPDRPGQYILAVECDGATYHGALWARERDRLRQDILENQGWRFHRIWSTDWFYRRDAEQRKLKEALEDARENADPA